MSTENDAAGTEPPNLSTVEAARRLGTSRIALQRRCERAAKLDPKTGLMTADLGLATATKLGRSWRWKIRKTP